MTNETLPVAVIGAGPVGLAAAAHLKASGHRFIVFEAGDRVGANILTWGHVRLFSPWRYNIDKEAEQLLIQHGVELPDKNALPTGHELVDKYLSPLASVPDIQEHLHLTTRVLSVGRKGLDKVKTEGREKLPFSIQVQEEGAFRIYEAQVVIDASGTWASPNPMGSGGVDAIGEKDNQDRINYAIPDILGRDKSRYRNKSVLVVGSGHSAVNSILELDALARDYPSTTIHWILRKDVSKVYGGKEQDALAARGALGSRIEELVNLGRLHIHLPAFIHQVRHNGGTLTISGIQYDEPFVLEDIDEVITNTGSRPDFSFLRELRFDADAAIESVPDLADLIDPNIHSCGTVRPHGEAELRQKEEGFYIVGMKSYGRAPTFLMATGYEQVRSIVAHLSGDEEAARRVELDLPQTGVCSSGLPVARQASGYSTLKNNGASCRVGELPTAAVCDSASTDIEQRPTCQ